MGNSSSQETHYTYVDKTEKERREALEREATRLENERKRHEKEERERLEKEQQQEEEGRREELRRQLQKEKEEEEKRRKEDEQKSLQLEAELCRRRYELKNYEFGDKIKLDSFLGLEIDDVTQLRIGVFGSAGSGKSCFINTVERTVRETAKGTVPDLSQTKGEEGTIILQDYLPELFFHLVDTRSFFKYDSDDIVEFQNVLSGKIQPGDIIFRPKKGQLNQQVLHRCPAFGQRLHGAIIVVKANDPRLNKGALRDYWKPFQDNLRQNGISPITVITHTDELKGQKEKDEAREDAYKATRSSPSNTFFMWNYTKDNSARNPEIERMTFDILHYALITAERAVKQMKHRERNKREDEMMKALQSVTVSGHVAPDSPDASVEVFLRFLQQEYGWSTTNIVRISNQLVKDDITSVSLLAQCWSHVQDHFPSGMSRMIQKELRKRGMLA